MQSAPSLSGPLFRGKEVPSTPAIRQTKFFVSRGTSAGRLLTLTVGSDSLELLHRRGLPKW
nr:hypothetical protein SHINE37_30001 [Rhizobiaceae bacterium]